MRKGEATLGEDICNDRRMLDLFEKNIIYAKTDLQSAQNFLQSIEVKGEKDKELTREIV